MYGKNRKQEREKRYAIRIYIGIFVAAVVLRLIAVYNRSSDLKVASSPISETSAIHNWGPVFSEDSEKRQSVLNAFKYAWRPYERNAFGSDQYHPLTKRGSNVTGPNSGGIGFMVVDAIDTMLLMKAAGDRELSSMYERSYSWLANRLDFNSAGDVNTQQAITRLIGGLLSAHHLSGGTWSSAFLDLATELADRILPAFETPTGIPLTYTNFNARQGRADMSNSGLVRTADASSIQLEFRYIAHLVGDDKYWLSVSQTTRSIGFAIPEDLLVVPSLISPLDGRFHSGIFGFGLGGTLYYESIVSQYLQTNRSQEVFRETWNKASSSLQKLLFRRTANQKLLYAPESKEVGDEKKREWEVTHKQHQSACALAGALMLGATQATTAVPPRWLRSKRNEEKDWATGVSLLKTCMDTHRTATGLGADIVSMYDELNQYGKSKGRDWYILGGDSSYPMIDARYDLRPEVVKSLFYAFRLTGDPIYRDYGWQIFRAIERHCKIPESRGGGYASIRNVDRVEGSKGWEDKMEPFLLSGTLKYLFLLFSDASLLPLKDYVFNAEGHPLPVFTPSDYLLKSIDI